MKLPSALLLLSATTTTVEAFLRHPTLPTHTHTLRKTPSSTRQGTRGLKAIIDPNDAAAFLHHHLPSTIEHSQALLQSLQGIADAAIDAAPSMEAATTEAAKTGAAAAAAANNGGWLAAPIGAIEKSITFIHDTLSGFGVQNTYGLAIIGFTILVKIVTLPLNYKQIESTTKMQAIQPMMKEIQAKYKSDPQLQQQKMAQLYQENEVNPLAGCLPALVQIPVFISLYRALTNLAAENKLDEPFLWLPSLEGPTYGAGPTDGMNWLKQWDGFTPSLGWHDTIAFLTIPLILIVSQSISQQILQPQQNKDDPATQQSQAILKFLPFMVGYFSLNVASGLGVYWIANNLITTLTTVIVRQVIQSKEGGDGLSATTMSSTSVVPETTEDILRRGSGFGRAPPPPTPKKNIDDVEDESSGKDTKNTATNNRSPAQGISADERMGRTEKGSVVEVLKQEGGLTVLREVKDNKVVSTTVRLTPDEMRRRKEALERGEDPSNIGSPPPPSMPDPTNDPRQNKRSKRRKK